MIKTFKDLTWIQNEEDQNRTAIVQTAQPRVTIEVEEVEEGIWVRVIPEGREAITWGFGKEEHVILFLNSMMGIV